MFLASIFKKLVGFFFFDGLLIFRILQEHEKFGYTQKKTGPRFQVYLISYIQNKLGLLSIQQRETNIYNQEITYKNITNTMNIGHTKHKKGYSHRVTGTLILIQRNEEYCFTEFIQLCIFNLLHSTMDFKCD